MANSIDDFLSKSSQTEQDKFKGLVADATKDTKETVKLQEAATPPQTQAIATAPPQSQGLDKAQPNAETMSKIQSVEKGQGNNHENAVDRALAKTANPSEQQPQKEKQQDKDR
jgi:hypothetical protein